MYFTEIDEQSYGLSHELLVHMLIYKSKLRSYRDLPLRLFELAPSIGMKNPVLHGLLRCGSSPKTMLTSCVPRSTPPGNQGHH